MSPLVSPTVGPSPPSGERHVCVAPDPSAKDHRTATHRQYLASPQLAEASFEASRCAVFYDLDTLAEVDVAFDCTAASADGDRVTFTAGNWFTGGSGDEVTLNAMGIAPGTITSAGAALQVGQRYLVSGSGGNVWSCGFTMT